MDCWKTRADYDTMTLEFISYLHQDGYVPREFFTPLNGKDTVVELSYFRSEFVDDPDVARVPSAAVCRAVVASRARAPSNHPSMANAASSCSESYLPPRLAIIRDARSYCGARNANEPLDVVARADDAEMS